MIFEKTMEYTDNAGVKKCCFRYDRKKLFSKNLKLLSDKGKFIR